MELLNALGLDVKILIAQLLNFSILLFVLYKFAYKPMFKLLDDRKNKIEKGVENAKKAEERLLEISEKEQDVLKKAKKEVALMLSKAHKQAEEREGEIVERAKEKIAEVIKGEKQKIQKERDQSIKDIKKEIGSLVVMAMENILGSETGKKVDKKLIEEAVKKI